MWYERKREEDVKRKMWLAEHQKMLEDEIRKYSEHKGSDRVKQAYKCWVTKKGSAPPKLPSRCSERARPLGCYKSRTPEIPELHKKQITDKVQEQGPKLVQYSPRQHLERVKKIQELRNGMSPRDVTPPPREITPQTREVTPHTRDLSTPKLMREIKPRSRDIACHSPKTRPKVTKHRPISAPAPLEVNTQFRIAKPQPAETKPKSVPKKRRKRKKTRIPVTPEPDELPVDFTIKVDNYFKASPLSPDSGCCVDDQQHEIDETGGPPGDLELEINSIRSAVSVEKLIELLGSELEKTGVRDKTVTFSENVFYDSEHHSVSFGNSLEHLRSCIKVKSLPPY